MGDNDKNRSHPITMTAAGLNGRRQSINDGWTYVRVHDHLVVVFFDVVGNRRSLLPEAILFVHLSLLLDQGRLRSAKQIAQEATVAADTAFRLFTDEADEVPPAASFVVAVVNCKTLEYCVGWLGDCRVFRSRPDGTYSLLNRPIHNLGLDPSRPSTYTDRNVVTRCLGPENELPPDTVGGQLIPGDGLVVCCDGVIEAVQSGSRFWWKSFIENPPANSDCSDNATVLAFSTEGALEQHPSSSTHFRSSPNEHLTAKADQPEVKSCAIAGGDDECLSIPTGPSGSSLEAFIHRVISSAFGNRR